MGELHLNNRLKKVAAFVRPNAVVADIGTDHGYLPVWLLLHGKVRGAIAADLREGPLSAAARTVEQYGVSDRVRLILSDGLNQIDKTAFTDLVIAGMGGEQIVEILDACGWLKNPDYRLILQPMTRAETLRRYLCENGFSISAEAGVRDRRFVYCVLCAAYTGRRVSPDRFYCTVGELPRGDDPDNRLYIVGQIQKAEKRRAGYRRAGLLAQMQAEDALLEQLRGAIGG